MYNKIITVGGGVTPTALAAGLRLDASSPIPGVDWLHVDGHFRASYWSMEIGEGFEEPVSDALHDVAALARAQKAFDVGGAQVSPGLAIGLAINDFIVYKLIQEDGLPYIEHDQLLVIAGRAGLRLAVDMDLFGKPLHLDSGLDVDVNVAQTGTGGFIKATYPVYDAWSVTAHAGALNRVTDVWSNNDDGSSRRVGSLEDGYTYLGLGATWSR